MWKEAKALFDDVRKGKSGFMKLILITGMILKPLTLNKCELPFPSPEMDAIKSCFTRVMWGLLTFALCFARGLNGRTRSCIHQNAVTFSHCLSTLSYILQVHYPLKENLKINLPELFESVYWHLPHIFLAPMVPAPPLSGLCLFAH